jgi:hypothetical protein
MLEAGGWGDNLVLGTLGDPGVWLGSAPARK